MNFAVDKAKSKSGLHVYEQQRATVARFIIMFFLEILCWME